MSDAAGQLLDVVIVGGGPVGACAAALLARESVNGTGSLQVAVLEPRIASMPAAQESYEQRVVALSRASERILKRAGAWERLLASRLQPYERMRIWHERAAPYSAGTLVFDAAEIGEPNLGYILETRMLQAALLDALAGSGGRIERAEFLGLAIEPRYVKISTSAGTLCARLLLAADGAHSPVRRAIGLTADSVDLHQTAIVANIATERPHAQTAYQRFMRKGTLAFLPLANGNTSIVWSADNDLAARLLGIAATDFEGELRQDSDRVLGATRLVTERVSFPLRRLRAHRYVAHRTALLGDAAHVVHPLAGQGVNLGLLDAAAIAQLITDARREREDPGADRVLRRYERWRKSEVALMDMAIGAFDRFLAHGTGPVAQLAQLGLGWVNRSQELKKLLAARALGVTGELPRAAR